MDWPCGSCPTKSNAYYVDCECIKLEAWNKSPEGELAAFKAKLFARGFTKAEVERWIKE